MLLWERAPVRDQTSVDHPHSAAGVASHKEDGIKRKKGPHVALFSYQGQSDDRARILVVRVDVFLERLDQIFALDA